MRGNNHIWAEKSIGWAGVGRGLEGLQSFE